MIRAWAIAILIAVIAVCIFGVKSWGAPPEDARPEFADWFNSLRTATGGSCCSIADCRHYSYRTAGDHYEIDYNGQWLVVPNSALIPRYDNPTGRAVACVYSGSVLCFVKAAET